MRLKGQPPVAGVKYELERLRCGLCGKVHTAPLPDEAGAAKYDSSVASVLATLRYGQGLPFYRIEQMQRAAGIPLPASVQWQLVRDALERGILDIWNHLLHLGAQGELFYNDDTHMRVLELSIKKRRGEPLREDAPHRKGVMTTGILSKAEGRPTITLFFTGPRHSGENLRELLQRRLPDLPPPLQMCDALSQNLPGELETIVANCLAHGRRSFYDLATIFPAEVERVLESLKQVYQVDAEAKQQGLSPQERLRLHQLRSGPAMEGLHTWLTRQFEERLVEPHGSLGKAIAYLLRHWEKLTLFLRVAGAPLDNNLCEQALKRCIRHRKNSLFYQTMRRAQVGDIYMSLIHTCQASSVDAFSYLTALQRNHERVRENPALWLPWNYREQLLDPEAASRAGGQPRS